jgi:lipopolysaccharide export system protein LptA
MKSVWFVILGVVLSVMNNGNGHAHERLRLLHADSLVSVASDQKRMLKLLGNVKLVQGKAYIICDMAHWWENEGRTETYGNVSIYDGKRTLTADEVHYDGQSRVETAVGHVLLESGSRRLKADKMVYSQNTEEASAFGRVVLSDFVEEAVLKGDRAFYDRATDYGRVEGKPQLSKIDSVSGEEIIVRGLKMEAWGQEQRTLVSDSVSIEKGDLKALCNRAEYFSEKQILVLNGKPVVWKQDQEMCGDQIDIRLDETRFTGGIIQGSARVVSTDSVYQDVLEGKMIRIEAVRDTIEKVIVEGQASSVYHIFDEESNEQGTNTTTGDKIVLDFEGDRLKKVSVESRPGQCTGLFTPAESAPEDENESVSDDQTEGI